MRRLPLLLLLPLCVRLASAQTDAAPAARRTQPDTAAPPLLSPQAAYDQANMPIDIIHRDLDNWSDIEKDSRKVAVAEAKDACLARVSMIYTGDDLISYARLCAFGEQWQNTYTAATTYINSRGPRPQLAMAYTFEVQADLNLNHEDVALRTCIAMLNSVPYDALTDEVTTTTVRYLEFAYTNDALVLLSERQPFLLAQLKASKSGAAQSVQTQSIPTQSGPANSSPAPSPPGSATTPPPSASPVPVHTLFEHALDYAVVLLYDNQPRNAAAVLKHIDDALPTNLPPDEAIFIAADRRQYALIGTRFPKLPGAVSLLPANDTPQHQPQFGSADVFLLFPPWCAQCIRQAKEIVPALVSNAVAHGPDSPLSGVKIYALLADTPPPPAPTPAPSPVKSASATAPTPAPRAGAKGPANPPTTKITISSGEPTPPSAEEQLRKTATLVVAPSTLADFNATDFPFLIATDHDGVIRLMVPAAPSNALYQGGPVEQTVTTILTHWPPPKPTSSPKPSQPPAPR